MMLRFATLVGGLVFCLAAAACGGAEPNAAEREAERERQAAEWEAERERRAERLAATAAAAASAEEASAEEVSAEETASRFDGMSAQTACTTHPSASLAAVTGDAAAVGQRARAWRREHDGQWAVVQSRGNSVFDVESAHWLCTAVVEDGVGRVQDFRHK